MNKNFSHLHAAHCESGVTSNLLTTYGHPISEPMAFGIGSGLFFLYLPYFKVMEVPVTSYRSFPGTIFKKACRRLGIPYEFQRFRDSIQGARQLDRLLEEDKAIGLQSNIYWLPYIPEAFRFQFNAHNLIAYGKEADDLYKVSDPVLETPSVCSRQALQKARFASGALAPKGLLYYPLKKEYEVTPKQWRRAIDSGISETCSRMLGIPFSYFGIKGIRKLASAIEEWPSSLKDPEKVRLYLSNVVRMQEEIGTGGAGFRYLYSAFLQEAFLRTKNEQLAQASEALTAVGNSWREFATQAARFCKGRSPEIYSELPSLLRDVATKEEKVFKTLKEKYLLQ